MQESQHKINVKPVTKRDIAHAITQCRVCQNSSLVSVLSLGDQYVSDFVDNDTQAGQSVPLELVLCDASQGGCGLLQLKHTAPAQSLYRNYWYRSGINQTMRDALADITTRATELVPLSQNDVVLDIGSNDNTLLGSYQNPGIQKIGFEPATNLLSYAATNASDTHIINNFFSAPPFLAATHNQPAKIITSIAMFYDLDDPNAFTADIATCLDKDGLWIIQMAYLPTMLLDNIFDNICHEHLEYYSLLSLENLLTRHNLKIIDVELNDVNGGSLRTYITHQSNTSIKPRRGSERRLANLRQQEKDLRLEELSPYQEFAQRVEDVKEKVTSFIRQEVKAGKTVYCYGASTKGNTLLQYFGLDHTVITAAAERNPDKWGKKTVGTLIPIISEAEARAAKPDYFLVLPWHFLPEFKKREKEYLAAGGRFIVPLPQFQVIGQ